MHVKVEVMASGRQLGHVGSFRELDVELARRYSEGGRVKLVPPDTGEKETNQSKRGDYGKGKTEIEQVADS